MIFDKLINKKIEKLYTKTTNKIDKDNILGTERKAKMIKNTMKAQKIILNLIIGGFLIYFFTNILFNKIGFEKTIIIIAFMIMFREWTKD